MHRQPPDHRQEASHVVLGPLCCITAIRPYPINGPPKQRERSNHCASDIKGVQRAVERIPARRSRIATYRTRSRMSSFRLPSRLGMAGNLHGKEGLRPVRIIDANRNGGPVCVKAHKNLLLPDTDGMGS